MLHETHSPGSPFVVSGVVCASRSTFVSAPRGIYSRASSHAPCVGFSILCSPSLSLGCLVCCTQAIAHGLAHGLRGFIMRVATGCRHVHLGASRPLGFAISVVSVLAAFRALAAGRLRRLVIGWSSACKHLTSRSKPLPSVAGRCAIKRRAAPFTYNVRLHLNINAI